MKALKSLTFAGAFAVAAMAGAASAEDREIAAAGQSAATLHAEVVGAAHTICASAGEQSTATRRDIERCVRLTVDDAIANCSREDLKALHAAMPANERYQRVRMQVAQLD